MSTPSIAGMAAMEGVAPELLPDKDKIYFNDYATLVQQQGMLQDSVRTSIYQFAVLENRSDFEGKRVMDVGAGTGILSFFAARGGASTVYAVEASLMAHKAEKLAAANGLGGVVKVLNQRVEEVSLDAKVDVLISEPLGIALVNERMLESYIAARDAHLKPGGKMFPDRCVMYAAPFSDEALYSEQLAKTAFWCQSNFYGVDLNSLRDDAQQFYFSQPVVGPVNPASLVSTAAQHVVDLSTITLAELTNFTIPFDYGIELITQARARRAVVARNSGAILAKFSDAASSVAAPQIHGIALWFDCRFPGATREIFLSTAPHEPLTHWYQVRCMLRAPLPVGPGHRVQGQLKFEANESRGYNIHVELTNAATGVKATNTIVSQCALHHFQYTSQQTYAYPAYAPQPTQPMAGPQTSVATSTNALPAAPAPMSVSPVNGNGEANV